jgi:hypothetical protein
VPERSNGAVLKTVGRRKAAPGFESQPRRLATRNPVLLEGWRGLRTGPRRTPQAVDRVRLSTVERGRTVAHCRPFADETARPIRPLSMGGSMAASRTISATASPISIVEEAGTSGRARRRLCSQPRSTGSSLPTRRRARRASLGSRRVSVPSPRRARSHDLVCATLAPVVFSGDQQGRRRAGAPKEAPTAGLPAQLQVAPTRLCRSGDAKLPTIRPGARDRCRLRGRSQGCPGASAAQAVRGSRR